MNNTQTNNSINELHVNPWDSFSDEAAFALAAAILKGVYNDYVSSLKNVVYWWKQKKKCPIPSNLQKWKDAIAIKNSNENFYYTQRFQRLSMGKAGEGKDVVAKIQDINNYHPGIYER